MLKLVPILHYFKTGSTKVCKWRIYVLVVQNFRLVARILGVAPGLPLALGSQHRPIVTVVD